ncbi:hypothetical protein ACH4NC_18690 [Streptomyces sp. NPDC017201]|uniref:hypothetical protein n=1 Tax=unclassified Streptomyces TaxID=2593676 RepID=UPI0037898583
MIDYYAHVAVLEQLRAQVPVAGGGAGPAELAQLQEFADAAAAEEGAALVGLFTDHVLTHASADGTEADLLERAGDLWKTGKDLYEGIGEVRQVVEKALQTPDEPDAADSFNQAMARMVVLLRKAKKLSAGVRQLRKDLRPLKHLPPHPRQAGLQLSDWGYGDVFLARRQDAFTRTVFSRAGGDTTARALAFGVLASYAGNVTGSAYLAQGVGGPRRSHRFRNRLARNAVGGWCARQYTVAKPRELADKLRPLVPASDDATPSAVAQVLAQALSETYDPALTPPLPDIDLGLRRTLRQLELYDVIRRPPLPRPVVASIAVRVHTTAGGGLPETYDDQGFEYPHSDQGAAPGTVDEVSGADTTGQAGDNGGGCPWWAYTIIGTVVFLMCLGISCIVGLVASGSCKEGVSDFFDGLSGDDEPEQPTSVTGDALIAVAASPAGPQIAQRLFEVHTGLWQAADEAFNYLALVGLVPPDDLLLTSPLHRQFLSLPVRELHPLREEPAAEKTYAFDPVTAHENPPTRPSPYPPGADPSVFVEGAAPEQALNLLLQILRGEQRSENLDADADRGYRHRCWTTDPYGSVHDDPVPVQVLAYHET